MRIPLYNWKIYLDTCCLSRLDDDVTHARIQQEATAIETILNHCYTEQWLWIGSEILAVEVNNTQNQSKRLQAQSRLNRVHQNVFLNLRETSRAKHLESLGFKRADALHLACAESGNTDLLLTTDDQMLRKARSISSQLRIRVENPLTWLQEVTENEYTRPDSESDS